MLNKNFHQKFQQISPDITNSIYLNQILVNSKFWVYNLKTDL